MKTFFSQGHPMWGAVTLFFVACPMIVSGCVEFLTSYSKKVELDEPISKYDVTVLYPNTQKVVRVNFNIYCTHKLFCGRGQGTDPPLWAPTQNNVWLYL